MFDGSGNFLTSLFAGLKALVMGFVNPIIELVKFVGKLVAAPFVFLGNLIKGLFTGDFSNLGRNVPLFGTPIPDIPAETITGVGGAGVVGNTGILIQSNNIDASNKSQTHQYSSTNITDSQAENTGL